jgi:hypothetical protein
VKEELEKIRLGSVWQNQYEYNNSVIYRVVKGRCDDIEKQNLFSRLSEKISLVFYQEMKQEWGRKEYNDRCNSNERRGMAWWRLGIWKLRGSRKGAEKGTCPLCLGKEDTKYILLERPETKNWRTEMCKRWLGIKVIPLFSTWKQNTNGIKEEKCRTSD